MIYNYEPEDTFGDSLEHHGIAGQKWGVKHGPPYPLVEGAKKVTYNLGKMTDKTKASVQKKVSSIRVSRAAKKTAKAEAKQAKIDAKNAKKTNIADAGPKQFSKSKQRISDMSSEELQARINRLKLEQEYKKYLNGGVDQQKKAGNGKSKLDSVLNAVGNSTIKKVGDELIIGMAKVAVTAATDAAKNNIARRNDQKKRNAEFINEERKQRRAEANYEKERARKNRDSYEDSYYKALGANKAKYDSEQGAKEAAAREAAEERRRQARENARRYSSVADSNRYGRDHNRSRYESNINLGRSFVDAIIDQETNSGPRSIPIVYTR